MKRIRSLLALGAFAMSLGASAHAAELRIGTASQGGAFYPVGQAISTLVGGANRTSRSMPPAILSSGATASSPHAATTASRNGRSAGRSRCRREMWLIPRPYPIVRRPATPVTLRPWRRWRRPSHLSPSDNSEEVTMFEALSRRRLIRGAAGASLASLIPGAACAEAAPDAPWQVSPEARLRELGIELHTPPPPVATYVGTRIVGNMLYVAGHTPRMPDASPGHQGIVGQDLTIEEGQAAARQCGINILATMRAGVGSLDRVARLVRTFGMVNAVPGFTQQPAVINGFSDFMVEIFGEEAGKGTRAAVGMGSLPGNMSVEIETFWELRA